MDAVNRIELKKLQFPIGPFRKPEVINQATIDNWIQTIGTFPDKLDSALELFTSDMLDWPYRPEGWSVKQVIHHCADSHMNSMMRFKWSLTEDRPTIKAYYEERWAELPDSLSNDLSYSLQFLRGLHGRWVYLLSRLSETQLKREFVHPEHGKAISLAETIGNYAWHGEHHLAHIDLARKSEGAFLN